MRIRLIGSVVAAFGLSTFGLSTFGLAIGAGAASAVDRIPPLLSAPSAEDNMPRAQTGEALPIPGLLTHDGPWAQPRPLPSQTGARPPALGDGGLQRFDSLQELERAMQWHDLMRAFERLLLSLRH